MKTCEEMTKSVLKRVHENNTAQKKRRAVVLRTAIPVCGAFAIAGTAALAQFTAKTPISGSNSAIAAGSGDMTDIGELSEEIMSDSSNFATSMSTSQNKPFSIPWNEDFSPVQDDRTKIDDKLQSRAMTEKEAIDYYNIDILVIEKNFSKFIRSDCNLTVKKYPDGRIDDSGYVEYENPEKTELLAAMFRKVSKWQPTESYEPYYFAGSDVYFFKDSAESTETRAVFEVNGTQITLLYSGTNEKMLLNAIKVFVNEKCANPDGNMTEEPVCG